jgi:predicted HTH domain antitoxin
MATRTIKVHLEVPDGISDQTRQAVQTQAEETAILALWQSGELSTRRAAEELGLGYHEFLDLLAAKGIPAVSGGEINTAAIEAAQRKRAGDRP